MNKPTTLRSLASAIEAREIAALSMIVRSLIENGGLAETLQTLPNNQLRQLLTDLGDERAAEMLGDLEPEQAAAVLNRVRIPEQAEILEVMSPDEATDILSELPTHNAENILIQMTPESAQQLRELQAYPPESAGGRMTPAFVALDPDLRADEAVVALRHISERAETIHYIYVTDEDDKLLGVLALRNLVLSPPETRVGQIMESDVVVVPVDMDQEIAARLLVAHDYFALPVVDEDRRLLGIITSDDVADILEAEATEDIERLGGSSPLETPYLDAEPLFLVRKRLGWLLVLFAGAAYTTTVLRFFQDEIEAVVALSFFIPLLIGTGGNTGSQVVTTLVRAMAVENVGLHNVARIVDKEMRASVLIGVAMALVMLLLAAVLDMGSDIAIVVASSVFAIVCWASLIGATLPLILRRFNIDPAVVSAPLITTIVDGTGLTIYFLIARVVLDLY